MSNFLKKELGAQDSGLRLTLQGEGELRFPMTQEFQTVEIGYFSAPGWRECRRGSSPSDSRVPRPYVRPTETCSLASYRRGTPLAGWVSSVPTSIDPEGCPLQIDQSQHLDKDLNLYFGLKKFMASGTELSIS